MAVKISTSYYAKQKNADMSYLLLQVSNTKPDWFIPRIIDLSRDVSPSWSLINRYKNGQISYNNFGKQYIEELSHRTSKECILYEIERLASVYCVSEVVLLCWEKDLNTCHRAFLAEWLTGVPANEV